MSNRYHFYVGFLEDLRKYTNNDTKIYHVYFVSHGTNNNSTTFVEVMELTDKRYYCSDYIIVNLPEESETLYTLCGDNKIAYIGDTVLHRGTDIANSNPRYDDQLILTPDAITLVEAIYDSY